MVVEIGFELGDAMARGVHRGQAGGVVAVPQLKMLVGRGTACAGRVTLGLRVAVPIEGFTEDALVPVDG